MTLLQTPIPVLLHASAALLCSAQEPAALGEVLVVSPRDELPLTSSAATVSVVTSEELERTNERLLPRPIARAASFVNLLDEEYRVHGSGIEGPRRSAVLSVRASF